MFDKFLNFVHGVSINWYGKLGVMLTTSSFIVFIIFEIAWMLGVINNAYVGLIIYMALPALFIIGLILIPIGWRKAKRTTGKTSRELLERRFPTKEVKGGFLGSGIFRTILFLTIINIIFVGGASMQMLNFMDRPHFCGTACHSVMNPEWTTYLDSPHARVKCVECHVGQGLEAAIDAKINGLWQIISATFNLYEKPIPTPVHNLRPARETCEECHWPQKFYGYRMQTRISYASDSLSTPTYRTLNLKIDAGRSDQKSGIHWHISDANEVRYTSVDNESEEMIWVDVKQPDNTFRRYYNRDLDSSYFSDISEEDVQTMDCIDCHNRATHIYEDPKRAIDERIRLGILNRDLPYLKREALAAITGGFPDLSSAFSGINNHINSFYKRNYQEIYEQEAALIDSTVNTLCSIYARNIHPEMNITWGVYPSHIGHKGSRGCFRCHLNHMTDKNDEAIPFDCTLCHSILAHDEKDPFEYLVKSDTTDALYEMREYLRKEFLGTFPQPTEDK